MKRLLIILLVCAVPVAVLAYAALNPPEGAVTAGTEIEVIDGLTVTYLATPALFDRSGLHPRADFGVASNGNVVMNADEGVLELEVRNRELAVGILNPPPPLDSLALDGGAVTLGIRDRFFGQLGSEGFQMGFPLPSGDLRLATSSRPGWVYLFRNARASGRLYGIWDNGRLSMLAEFPSPIRAVADDEDTTFVATDAGLLAIDEDRVRVIARVTPDLGPAQAIAARAEHLFVTANDRVYVLADGMLLAIARGIAPALILRGDRLYCWDHRRRLLLAIDVGPLFAA